MKRFLFIALTIVCLQQVVMASDFVWFDGKSPITYSVPKKVEPVVGIALEMWMADTLLVTHVTPLSTAKPKI